MTQQQTILHELLTRFPNAGTHTLAKKAFKENPRVFLTYEAARSSLRYLRGNNGRQNMKTLAIKSHVRKSHSQPGHFDRLPEGLTHFKSWKAHQISGPMRALILSDIHWPYHDKAAVVAALEYGTKHKADTIILNGDTFDHFAVSFWEKDPNKRDFAKEVESGRDFLQILRRRFPAARIVFKKGNHEERYDRYMRVKAPELLNVAEFSLESLMQFDRLKIWMVDEMRVIRLGKLNVVHGHEFRFAIAGPVNPARGFYMKAKTHCLGGHFHRSSNHAEKDLEEHVISTWSTGCLCDMHPDYAPINGWNHGFAFVRVEKGGAFHVENLRVIDGRVY